MITKVIIDADACPVLDIILQICSQEQIACLAVCDFNHQLNADIDVLYVEQGSDSADFKIVSMVTKEVVVVTNDYGLAALVLSKQGKVVTFDGLDLNAQNIEIYLQMRDMHRRMRKSKQRYKNISKRTVEQNKNFKNNFIQILKKPIEFQ